MVAAAKPQFAEEEPICCPLIISACVYLVQEKMRATAAVTLISVADAGAKT